MSEFLNKRQCQRKPESMMSIATLNVSSASSFSFCDDKPGWGWKVVHMEPLLPPDMSWCRLTTPHIIPFPKSHSEDILKAGSKLRLWGELWLLCSFNCHSLPKSASTPNSTAELGFQPTNSGLQHPALATWKPPLFLWRKPQDSDLEDEMGSTGRKEKHNLTKDKHGCIWK